MKRILSELPLEDWADWLKALARQEHPERTASLAVGHLDLAARRFTRLVVLGWAGHRSNANVKLFLCQCDCGELRLIPKGELVSAHRKSCGCLGRENLARNRTKHGHAKGGTLSKAYTTWRNIRQRCNDSGAPSYQRYGGRGIRVLWKSFEAFYRDMGDKPPGMTIERIDNNGHYCKENCKWATQKEQANNRRSSRWLTLNGKTRTLAQWGHQLGKSNTEILHRLKRGWSIERALTTKPRQTKRKANHDTVA